MFRRLLASLRRLSGSAKTTDEQEEDNISMSDIIAYQQALGMITSVQPMPITPEGPARAGPNTIHITRSLPELRGLGRISEPTLLDDSVGFSRQSLLQRPAGATSSVPRSTLRSSTSLQTFEVQRTQPDEIQPIPSIPSRLHGREAEPKPQRKRVHFAPSVESTSIPGVCRICHGKGITRCPSCTNGLRPCTRCPSTGIESIKPGKDEEIWCAACSRCAGNGVLPCKAKGSGCLNGRMVCRGCGGWGSEGRR